MKLAYSRTCAITAAVMLAAGLAACDRKVGTQSRTALAPDASAQVVGKTPAEPSGDPPGTTPVASNTTTVTKQEEISKKPQEGDDHSYSSVAVNNPQKGDHKIDAQQLPERKKE
jgi:hypothetical protein